MSSEESVERTLTQTEDDLRRASERSLQPTRPPLMVPGYRPERFLGAGAYGQVWVAVDTNTGRRVAIKFYLHRGGLDWTVLTREVERLALLFADRYVVQLIEVGWDSDPPYFVMEYLERGSLADRLNAGPLPEAEAVELFHDVAIGLVHAHGKGVLHCDLKPANVLLDQDGRPRLADFGQSRLSDEQSPSLGTLFYMAPEQADLQAAPDARWDVYALGALLHAMLTGSPPYRNAEALAYIQQGQGLEEQLSRYRTWIEESARASHRHVPGVDRALSDIVRRCLAVEPHRRYANPQVVLDALHARNARRARRPLLVVGLIGPMVLLLIVSFFGYNVFETSLAESRDLLARRALESDRFAAQFVAENVAREIDQRWETLEHIADNDQFREAVLAATFGGPDSTAADGLQTLLEKLDHELQLANSDSWYVLDRNGIQLARSPREEQVRGVNYAFRDYFHGQGTDLGRETRPEPLRRPHLSIVFTSEATGRRTVSLSVPIFSGDADMERGDVLGVFCHAVDLGHFAELHADERSGNDQIPVLIDCRSDDTRRRGAILEHPGLRRLLEQNTPTDDRFYLPPDTLERLEKLRGLRQEPHSDDPAAAEHLNELARIDGYRDPIGGEYEGHWLAAAEPVEVISRRDRRSRDTGWAVIVQERYQAAVAPVDELRNRLLWQAKVATTVVAVVLAALWGFLISVLNESLRLRWLSRLRQQTDLTPPGNTPDSASLTGSLSPSLSADPATLHADTQRGAGVASDTAQHEE